MNIWHLSCILLYLLILDLRFAYSSKNKTNLQGFKKNNTLPTRSNKSAHVLKNLFQSGKNNLKDDNNIKNDGILNDSGTLFTFIFFSS
jgi:hypothetical protein